MIQHVYRRASRATSIESVLVATDDLRIQRVVEGFGGRAVLTSADHPTGTDRLAEVARGLSAELIVNVQGDEPLIAPEVIDLAVSAFADTGPELVMSTLCCPFPETADGDAERASPHVVKVAVDRDGYALYFSRASLPGASKHLGLYVYRRDFLLRLAELDPTPLEQAERLEQLRVLEHGYRIKTLETTHDPIGVDTQSELERVRRIVTGAAE